jgi:uncharacterized protein YjiS (DUF1127 family)
MREMRHISKREQRLANMSENDITRSRSTMSYAAHQKDFRSLVAHKASVDGTTIDGEWTKPADAIGPWWEKIRRAWALWSARLRLRRSVAHLDDRLLADIGLSAEVLSISERLARRQADSLRKFLVC